MWVLCNRYVSLIQLLDDGKNYLPVPIEEPNIKAYLWAIELCASTISKKKGKKKSHMYRDEEDVNKEEEDGNEHRDVNEDKIIYITYMWFWVTNYIYLAGSDPG